MKTHLLTSLFILSSLFSFAQKQANIWYFGEYAGLDFNSGSPVPLSDGQMSTSEGCASIADKNTGQLLFYTDGTSVWDASGAVMPGCATGLWGNYSSTQSAVIVPMPGSTTLYYIFTVDAQAGLFGASTTGFGGCAYSIVDMTKRGGLGNITTLNTILLTPTSEKVTAVRHCNGKDIWVVTHQWDSNSFYAYLLTSTGLSAPVISNSGIVHQDVGSFQNAESIGYMKFSPDGKKLALACYIDLNTVQIFDFNNSTGIVSNPITDADFPNITGSDGPYGVSFSPDNSKLYIGYLGGEYSYVYQYNMLAGNSAAIIASKTAVFTDQGDLFGAIQIGPDGKIYVAKLDNQGGSSYLDVINNPNALGAACNYVADGLYLGGLGVSDFGLPDMVESFLAIPYSASLTYTGCAGNSTVTFTDTTLNGDISLNWNFGDPASGASNTSTTQNPTHTFSSSGNHTVTLYLTNACRTDTLTQVLNIGGGISASAGPDTSICSGNFVQLQAVGGTTYRWSPSAGLTDTTVANPVAIPLVTTIYTVTVSSGGCSSTETVTVNVNASPPPPRMTHSHDTLFCSFDASYTSYQWYFNSTLVPGSNKSYFVENQTGDYDVTVTNENGCQIAVGDNILGLQSFSLNNSITLFPNPAQDQIVISCEQGELIRVIDIYNVLGEKVYNQQLQSSSSKVQTTIDISNLSNGVYFVQVQGAQNKWVGKFLKE